jgi:putative salt-induced outer membrane protein YdiY
VLVLQLKNGDRISGVVVEENDQRLVLSNAWNPALTVDLAAIQERLVSPQPKAATGGVPEPQAAPLTNQTTVQPKKPSPWRGDWQVGVDLRRGERDSALYHSRLKVGYIQGRFRSLADLHYAYGKTDGTLNANRVEGSLKTDFDLNKRIFVYNYLDALFDEVRKIDLRYQVGPGLGYHLLMRTNLVLDLEAGGSYENERRSDGTRRDNFSVRLAQTMQWQIAEQLRLEESVDFYPRFSPLDDFRVRAEMSLRYFFHKRLSLNFSVLDVYDRTPAAGVSRNDLQLRTTLGVTF